MFSSIGKFLKSFQRIESIDETSSIERLGRDEYKYIEGDHALVLQVEMLVGTPKRVIYSSTIKKWLGPHENEHISEDKKKEIVQKICKYFELNGISHIVR